MGEAAYFRPVLPVNLRRGTPVALIHKQAEELQLFHRRKPGQSETLKQPAPTPWDPSSALASRAGDTATAADARTRRTGHVVCLLFIDAAIVRSFIVNTRTFPQDRLAAFWLLL